jgi:uncharacterized protein with ATP-grasp and redox domains
MTTTTDNRVALPLLAEPDAYRCNTLDLLADDAIREYWLDVFVDHLPSLCQHVLRAEAHTDDAQARADELARRFGAQLEDLRDRPDQFGELDIIMICRMREKHMRDLNIADPYAPVKAQENAAALELLPDVLAELDAMPDDQRLQALIVGTFAGNKFDLGATSTNKQFDDGGFSFHDARDSIQARPWMIDDFDALAVRWAIGPHRKAIVFVDNAGADVTLGMIPLIREMLRRGTHVVVTANTKPALNDILHDELGPHLKAIAAFDSTIADALNDGRLERIESGNDAPLVNLNQVSPQIAAASQDADLLILEGMGRAIETNLYARFTCDTLKLAMVKEEQLATMLGGNLYDVICKFEAGGSQ